MDKKVRLEHENKVRDVQVAMKGFYSKKTKVRIYHGSTTTTRSPKLDMSKIVDVSHLNEVLQINIDGRWAEVEPNVAMDDLVRATLRYGLVPTVVPELPAITVGGSVQGGAGESTSFKYGCFHEICDEYEVILGDGTLVTASRSSNTELYKGLPCSYGTIGVVTKIKLQLVPASKYVNLSYLKVSSYDEAMRRIEAAISSQTADFIDGIMFSPTKGVVMTGVYSNDKYTSFKTTTKYTDDWFYAHALSVINNKSKHTESIPLKDYFFRYDKGAFWVAKNGYEMFHVPFNKLTRILISGLLTNRRLYTFLNAAKLSQSYLVQDICIPVKNATATLEWLEKDIGIFPLWICPLKTDKDHNMSPSKLEEDYVINLGVWGKLADDYSTYLKLHQSFENKVHEFGGRKVLYGHVYASENEFWKSYNKQLYENLRKKFEAQTVFPTIYEKIHVNERYKPSIMRGLFAILKSK